METSINRLFIAFLLPTVIGCGGGNAGSSHVANTTDSSSVQNKEVPAAKLLIESTELEEIFKYAAPLQLTESAEVLTEPLAKADSVRVFTIQSSNDLINFIGEQKKLKRVRYDVWDMHDILNGEFYDADRDKPISDNSILQRGLLNAKELKYYKLLFCVSVRESSVYAQDGYKKIYGKLNDICKDCIPLEVAQIQKLEEKLKSLPNNYGIFGVLSLQQMASYGL